MGAPPTYDVVIERDGTTIQLRIGAPRTVARYLTNDWAIAVVSTTALQSFSYGIAKYTQWAKPEANEPGSAQVRARTRCFPAPSPRTC